MQERCEACKYYFRRAREGYPYVSECRRYPPTADYHFVLTSLEKWCGEFRSKENQEAQ